MFLTMNLSEMQILSKFPLLQESDLDAITLKEQFTRIVLASKSIVYAIGTVPYFVDFEGASSHCLYSHS